MRFANSRAWACELAPWLIVIAVLTLPRHAFGQTPGEASAADAAPPVQAAAPQEIPAQPGAGPQTASTAPSDTADVNSGTCVPASSATPSGEQGATLERLRALETQVHSLRAGVNELLEQSRRERAHAAWVARMQEARRQIRLGPSLWTIFGGAAVVGITAPLIFDATAFPIAAASLGLITVAAGGAMLGKAVRKRRAIQREIETHSLAPRIGVSASAHAAQAHLTLRF